MERDVGGQLRHHEVRDVGPGLRIPLVGEMIFKLDGATFKDKSPFFPHGGEKQWAKMKGCDVRQTSGEKFTLTWNPETAIFIHKPWFLEF